VTVPLDERLLVLYDADCGICTRTASILRRLDRRRRLRLVPLQRPPFLPDLPPAAELAEAMHVRDATGRWSRAGEAAMRIAAEVPALRPIARAARLPGVPGLIDVAYRLVARHRHTLSRWLGEQACRLPSRD
jgi:predicted DCC family thiol-disulfide oxidoreductase YuxK